MGAKRPRSLYIYIHNFYLLEKKPYFSFNNYLLYFNRGAPYFILGSQRNRLTTPSLVAPPRISAWVSGEFIILRFSPIALLNPHCVFSATFCTVIIRLFQTVSILYNRGIRLIARANIIRRVRREGGGSRLAKMGGGWCFAPSVWFCWKYSI